MSTFCIIGLCSGLVYIIGMGMAFGYANQKYPDDNIPLHMRTPEQVDYWVRRDFMINIAPVFWLVIFIIWPIFRAVFRPPLRAALVVVSFIGKSLSRAGAAMYKINQSIPKAKVHK